MTPQEFAATFKQLEDVFGQLTASQRDKYYHALGKYQEPILQKAFAKTIEDYHPLFKHPFPYPAFILERATAALTSSKATTIDDVGRHDRCPYCEGVGYILLKGKWSGPELGWGRDTVKTCWCEEGMIREKAWEHDAKERGFVFHRRQSSPQEVQQNDRDWRESIERWLAYLAETKPVEPPKVLLDMPPREDYNEKENGSDPPF